MTLIMKAQPLVDQLKINISERAKKFEATAGRRPGLSVILVGDDPASRVYVGKKAETANSLGIISKTISLPSTATAQEVKKLVGELNLDKTVDGILIQRPLPNSFDTTEAALWVSPKKDVDGLHPENVGLLAMGATRFSPCTPAGIMALLKHYNISASGKTAAVIGRSMIVGKPMAMLLTNAGATVTTIHRGTRNPEEICHQSDIVIVAAGSPQMVNAAWIKPGAVVVDVGIHRNASGKIVGDVDFQSVSAKASAITPVPGGVGPMTIHLLMQNTVLSAENSLN